MYHAIVRKKLYSVFERLNQGDYDYALQQLAPRFEHVFAGDHTFGGVRHTEASFRKWFERLFKCFPDLRFDVQNIATSGWPWDTLCAVEWIDRATLKDGSAYENRGVHFIRLKWGRLVSIHAYLDTKLLEDACQVASRHGVQEALAAKITD